MADRETPVPPPALERVVRVAARALGGAGLVHAYGHCSARIDERYFLVCAAKPMGLIAPGEDGTVCAVDGALPAGVLGEVRIHQQVYARRPEVGGICRTQPPNVMALSAGGLTPSPRHGFGAYFTSPPPLYADTRLLRDDASAAAVADLMGDRPAVVLRGNGAVVAGATLPQAVVLTWYLEDAARVELAVRSAGLAGAPAMSAGEAEARAVWSGGILERMWHHLSAGDPEAS